MFDFIESCLRHKSEMVIYEAAQAETFNIIEDFFFFFFFLDPAVPCLTSLRVACATRVRW